MSQPKIQNIFYVVGDMERATHFYAHALGLDEKFKDEERWAQFSAGRTNFALSSKDEAPPGAAGAVVVFEVDNLEDAKSQIESAGGRCGDVRDMGAHGRTLPFHDTEGNLCQLFQR